MDLQKCKFCGEDIAENIKRCPFCASSIEDELQQIVEETQIRNKPLNSWLKMIITIISVWPGFGQLVGVFIAVIYLVDQDDEKIRFGKWLLNVSIGLFVFWIVLALLGASSLIM
jgi:uncharacterized membrane protein YvbJ